MSPAARKPANISLNDIVLLQLGRLRNLKERQSPLEEAFTTLKRFQKDCASCCSFFELLRIGPTEACLERGVQGGSFIGSHLPIQTYDNIAELANIDFATRLSRQKMRSRVGHELQALMPLQPGMFQIHPRALPN